MTICHVVIRDSQFLFNSSLILYIHHRCQMSRFTRLQSFLSGDGDDGDRVVKLQSLKHCHQDAQFSSGSHRPSQLQVQP